MTTKKWYVILVVCGILGASAVALRCISTGASMAPVEAQKAAAAASPQAAGDSLSTRADALSESGIRANGPVDIEIDWSSVDPRELLIDWSKLENHSVRDARGAER